LSAWCGVVWRGVALCGVVDRLSPLVRRPLHIHAFVAVSAARADRILVLELEEAVAGVQSSLPQVRQQLSSLLQLASSVLAPRVAVVDARWDDAAACCDDIEASPVSLNMDVAERLAGEVAACQKLCRQRRELLVAGHMLASAMSAEWADVAALQAAVDACTTALASVGDAAAIAPGVVSPAAVQGAQSVLAQLLQCEDELAAAVQLMQPDLLNTALRRADELRCVPSPSRQSYLVGHRVILFCRDAVLCCAYHAG
jgi:hypothetical protein